jgi:hypothetical protein
MPTDLDTLSAFVFLFLLSHFFPTRASAAF